jgi:hypothetical protein
MRLVRILTIALACTGLVMAQASTTAAPAKAKTAKVSSLRVSGEIVSVDAIGNSVVIKAKKGEDTLSVDSATVVKVDGKAAKVADLSAGNVVSAVYKMDSGKMVATKISKTEPKAKAAKAPKAETPAAK